MLRRSAKSTLRFKLRCSFPTMSHQILTTLMMLLCRITIISWPILRTKSFSTIQCPQAGSMTTQMCLMTWLEKKRLIRFSLTSSKFSQRQSLMSLIVRKPRSEDLMRKRSKKLQVPVLCVPSTGSVAMIWKLTPHVISRIKLKFWRWTWKNSKMNFWMIP